MLPQYTARVYPTPIPFVHLMVIFFSPVFLFFCEHHNTLPCGRFSFMSSPNRAYQDRSLPSSATRGDVVVSASCPETRIKPGAVGRYLGIISAHSGRVYPLQLAGIPSWDGSNNTGGRQDGSKRSEGEREI